jgi:hypothetical protein
VALGLRRRRWLDGNDRCVGRCAHSSAGSRSSFLAIALVTARVFPVSVSVAISLAVPFSFSFSFSFSFAFAFAFPRADSGRHDLAWRQPGRR